LLKPNAIKTCHFWPPVKSAITIHTWHVRPHSGKRVRCVQAVHGPHAAPHRTLPSPPPFSLLTHAAQPGTRHACWSSSSYHHRARGHEAATVSHKPLHENGKKVTVSLRRLASFGSCEPIWAQRGNTRFLLRPLVSVQRTTHLLHCFACEPLLPA